MNSLSVIKFDKSYPIRWNEYNEIFNECDGFTINPKEMQNIWCSYLEVLVELGGWMALWKLSREHCYRFNLSFPTVVLTVMVDNVDLYNLSADVTIINNDDSNLQLPSTIKSVPLVELYPTTYQENNCLSVTTTAECLDQLRIFYKYLSYTWDGFDEDNSSKNWKSIYLDCRLKLYYYVLKEKGTSSIMDYMWYLVIETSKLHSMIENFENDIVYINGVETEHQMVQSAKYATKFFTVLVELSKIENYLQIGIINLPKEPKIGISVVVPKHSFAKQYEYFKDIYDLVEPTDIFKQTNDDLQVAITRCCKMDKVIICCAETYNLYSIGFLTIGGTLQGLYSYERPTIMDLKTKWSLCDFYGNETILKNVIFNFTHSKEGLIVHRGAFLDMKNVLIKHETEVFTQAVIIHEGASLRAEQCCFVGFKIAIVALPGSNIELFECTFEDNEIALKVYDGSQVNYVNMPDNMSVQNENGASLSALMQGSY